MSWDTIWWFLWVFVFFLGPELYAAKSAAIGDTFSENVWKWFGIKDKSVPFRGLRKLVLACFLTALTMHFLFATTVLWVALFGAPTGGIVLYSVIKERKR